jgi:hypothetical protein
MGPSSVPDAERSGREMKTRREDRSLTIQRIKVSCTDPFQHGGFDRGLDLTDST